MNMTIFFDLILQLASVPRPNRSKKDVHLRPKTGCQTLPGKAASFARTKASGSPEDSHASRQRVCQTQWVRSKMLLEPIWGIAPETQELVPAVEGPRSSHLSSPILRLPIWIHMGHMSLLVFCAFRMCQTQAHCCTPNAGILPQRLVNAHDAHDVHGNLRPTLPRPKRKTQHISILQCSSMFINVIQCSSCCLDRVMLTSHRVIGPSDLGDQSASSCRLSKIPFWLNTKSEQPGPHFVAFISEYRHHQ